MCLRLSQGQGGGNRLPAGFPHPGYGSRRSPTLRTPLARCHARTTDRPSITRRRRPETRNQNQHSRDRPAPAALAGFARTASQLYHDRRMSDAARRLVQKVMEWARGRGEAEAFVEQLADQLGLCVRATQYAQARAEECGYLVIVRTR